MDCTTCPMVLWDVLLCTMDSDGKLGQPSNLGPLRSHLLAFQAPYSKHWSGSRQVCQTCSATHVQVLWKDVGG